MHPIAALQTEYSLWTRNPEDLVAADVPVSPAMMARLDALFQLQAVVGSRYNAQGNSEVDTETF